ncbi:MAG TPA: response regulator transcription factor [Flavobacteriales bacterium]|nr:response regulator transcription factor [Flavobacteriales bacterium]
MDTKIRCILLDDELPGLTYLRMLCEQIPNVEVVKAYNNPILFLEESKKLEFDLCILDIEMPGMNGLEVARQLKNKPVIFTTAYKEYASEAFDLDAVDYIKKPIQKERLEKGIAKAREQAHKPDRKKTFAQFNTSKGKVLLFFDTVVYITTGEIDKRDKLAYLEDGTEVHLKNISFDQLLEIFPGNKFCRVNKKDIIAIHRVKHFNNDEITMNSKNSYRAGLSEAFKAEFIKLTR